MFNLVAMAFRPDAPSALRQPLLDLTRQMAADSNAPAEVRALGEVLLAVLSGERSPDLSALPEELAAGVREMLASLE